MTYAIVYDSRTGNTEELARAVAGALPAQGCLAFGRVDEVDAASMAQVDRVYAGFWTNRGDCTDEMGELLAGRGLEPAVRRAMDVLETLIRLERDEAEKNKGIRIEKYLSVLNQ